MAQLALGVAGAVVGNIIAPGIGGAIGFALGSAAGGYLFPEKFRGPGLNDNRVAGSSYGLPIPIVYSSARVPGNVIDRPAKYYERETTTGGKGGPEVTTISAVIAYCQLLLCESDGDVTIGRVYANKQLVDDYRAATEFSEHLPLVFYTGADDQLADPTLEAIHGVGTISAHRGFATVVMTDLGLERWGNTLPSFEFEVFRGTISAGVEGPIRSLLQNDATGFTWPNVTAPSDWTPAFPAITSWPRNSDDPIRIRERNEPTVRTYNSTTLAYIGSEAVGDGDNFPQDAAYAPDSEWHFIPIGNYVYDDDTSTALWAIIGTSGTLIAAGNNFPAISSTLPVGTGSFPSVNITGTNFAYPAGVPSGEHHVGSALSQDGRILLVLTGPTAASDADKWYRIVDGTVTSSGTVSPNIAFGAIGYASTYAFSNAISLENNGRWLWQLTSNTKLAKVYYIDDTGNLAFNVLGGSFNVSADPAISACCIATLATDGYAGVVYLDTLALLTRWTTEPSTRDMLLSEIAADICERARLSSLQYDVTDIPIPVRSYMLDQTPVTGRAALETILPCYLVQACDSAGVIKFIRAGKASKVTIPDIDLATHLNDEALPARLQIIRGSDENIPVQIIFEYVDIEADFQIGAQASPKRMIGASNGITVVKVPVGFTGAEAKRVVESWARIAIDNRDPAVCYVSRKYIEYEGTDVVTIQGIDWWIAAKNEGARGVIKLDLRRSRPTSLAEAGVAGSSGITPQELLEPQETELAVLDIPLLGADHRQGVIHVEMQGALRRAWRGAALMKSLDGGTNYTQQAIDVTPGTIGVTLNALPNYGGVSFDEASVLDVLIGPGGGELASATRDAVFAGSNLAMVGAEMIAYKNAVLTDVNEYRLTGLLRGLNGTEWAMRGHAMTDSPAVGETFVVLPAGVTLNATSADYGYTRKYKAVTLGRTLATADAVDFRSNGVPLAPYSPVHLRAGFNGSPGSSDVLLGWVRRSRLNPGWINFRAPTGTGPPLGEETEAYRVQIFEDGTYQTVVRTVTIVAGTDFDAGDPEFVYTVAMQTTDFGGALSTRPAWSVAQIGALGPGYSAYFNGAYGGLPLFVPSSIPGYVPPVPPPAGGILSVMDWNTPVRIFSGPFGPNDVWSIQFTTGNVPSPSNNFVIIAAAEYQGPYVTREWTLSPIRGDFGPQPKPGASGTGNAIAVFAVGADDYPFYPTVPFLSTWYLNIRNTPSIYFDMQMDCELANVP